MTAIPGLHHVTAISGPPQPNLDFYTGALRQRLVKRTVNFDDPGTYHLYYGDRTGSPGTILTFFPFADAGPGRAGPGMASAVSYAVPDLDAWTAGLAEAGIDAGNPSERLGERVLTLADPDGLRVEVVEVAPRRDGGRPDDAGDDGFHSVTLWLADPEPTARLMADVMGYREVGEEAGPEGRRLRLAAPGTARGRVVDLLQSDGPAGQLGAGTIHHVAFRAENAEVQRGWQTRLREAGLDVTSVIDRQYFDAIYFREPGGTLFEIATDPPGFAVDEPESELGRSLKLPERYEPMRASIERRLPPLRA